MNWKERNEYIKYFEQTMCTICRSKYCKGKISVTRKNGITSTICKEYNKTLGRPSKKSEKSNSL